MVVPAGGRDHPRWPEVVRFIAEVGVTLDPWQLMVLRQSLKRKAGKWAAFAVGVCAARQNGKNGILEIRELIGPTILDERLLIHSAHLSDTSLEGFRRLDDLIEDTPVLKRKVKHVWRGVGKEVIEFKNGNRIRFRTRTGRGGRGFSGSPVIFDEAMDIPEASMSSILPVISAQPDPQVWYTGSAVDQESMPDGNVFARVRQRALAGEDPRLAYFEWSVDAEKPDELEEAQAADQKLWAQANPALGIRISPEYVAAEMRELDPRSFAVERLGVGDWPSADGDDGPVSVKKWDQLVDSASEIVSPVCFAFDISPARSSAAIAVAGRNGEDKLHMEIVDHQPGTGWLKDRLLGLSRDHDVVEFVCDGRGPAAALIPELEEMDVQVVEMTAQEYGRACGFLVDLVNEQEMVHLGSSEIRSALRGAQSRDLGDSWAWARKRSTIDITPLVAATFALWSASKVSSGGFALV